MTMEPDTARLINGLKNPDAAERRAAAWALAKIGSQSSVRALLSALEDSDESVRIKAAWALGEIGDPVVVPALQQALNGTEDELSEAAAWALGKIGTPAIDALVSATSSPWPKIRARVAWAMIKLDPVKAAPIIDGLRQDPDPIVRLTASKANQRINRRMLGFR